MTASISVWQRSTLLTTDQAGDAARNSYSRGRRTPLNITSKKTFSCAAAVTRQTALVHLETLMHPINYTIYKKTNGGKHCLARHLNCLVRCFRVAFHALINGRHGLAAASPAGVMGWTPGGWSGDRIACSATTGWPWHCKLGRRVGILGCLWG